MVELYKKYVNTFKELEIVNTVINQRQNRISELQREIESIENSLRFAYAEKKDTLTELEIIQNHIKEKIENE